MKNKSTLTATETDLTRPLAASTVNKADISGMAACIEDARQAALDSDAGPPEPTDFHQLRGRLEAVRNKLPPLYRQAAVTPFIQKLDQIGSQGFNTILIRDPRRIFAAGLMLDIAQAILQQGEGFAEAPTDAFEEVVSDLYDGFLSAEDRRGVQPPDLGVVAPLVKWGNPDDGPYTWPIDATSDFGLECAVVNLPPANSRKGLFAWSALGHETAGHDILHADSGLAAELADEIRTKLGPLGHNLDEYWSSRIDETASDVLGILNMGPAAGIGLITYFRGLGAAFANDPRLRSDGSDEDPHPADVLRGYLAAETVALLKFTGRKTWTNLIVDETEKDITTIVLGDEEISNKLARDSARIVAQTLVTFRPQSLERHALGDIQNWRDSDERKVKRVRTALRTAVPLQSASGAPIFAAHVVAGAVMEALANGADIHTIFDRMIGLLNVMHDENPSWGPLFIRHPGNIARELFYRRQRSTSDIFEATEPYERRKPEVAKRFDS